MESGHQPVRRYFEALNLEHRTTHERLMRNCFIDYDREMALVDLRPKPDSSENEIVGVGHLTKLHSFHDAEAAILISDSIQGRGLGKELLSRLLAFAADEDLSKVFAHILPDNAPGLRIFEELGFAVDRSPGSHPVPGRIQAVSAEIQQAEPARA